MYFQAFNMLACFASLLPDLICIFKLLYLPLPFISRHLKVILTLSWVQWHMPAIPATPEAEAGGLCEGRSLRPVWATWRDPISKKKKKIYSFYFSIVVTSLLPFPLCNLTVFVSRILNLLFSWKSPKNLIV